MHILILCTYFPPLNRTGARRPYYLAKELLARGHRVSVFTSEGTEDAHWQVDLAGMEVKRAPREPMHQAMRPWQRWSARCVQWLQGSPLAGPARLLADICLPMDHRARWDLRGRDIIRLLGAPDVVLATVPDWSPAEIGAEVAAASNATFLLDYRDPWCIALPEVHMDIVSGKGKGPARWLRTWADKRREKRIGTAAFAISAASGPFLENARRITGNARGGAFISGYPPTTALPVPPANDAFTLVYAGRLYPEQDWDLVLSAIAILAAEDPQLHRSFRLQLIGPACNDARLLDRIVRFSREHPALCLCPRLGREEALQQQRGADALLHLAYRGRKGYLPVKFLEYLHAARPIILISHEQDQMESILRETATGVQIRQADALARLLRERVTAWKTGETWTTDPDLGKLRTYAYPERMRPLADQIETWHREKQASGQRTAFP
jgi:glycosyltransferase involved in cell wall biosynthesis